MIVQVGLVALPALWGMRQGASMERFRMPLRVVLWTVAAATLAALLIQEPGFLFFLQVYNVRSRWQIRWLNFAVYWPIVYLMTTTFIRHWRRHTAA